jgi:hypothetical protein
LIEAERFLWRDVVPATTFLIQRASAFREEHSQKTFDVLSSLYDEIASREEHLSPVVRISNDDLEISKKTIRESIASILKTEL